MLLSAHTLAGFVDELEKIAASDKWTVAKGRTGTRPISVDNLLKKHKDGTLYKEADAAGNPQDVRGDSGDDPGAAKMPHRQGEVPTKEVGIPVTAKTGQIQGANTQTPAFTSGEDPFAFSEAKRPRKKGEVPSKDDGNVVDRYDQRESATTVHGLGQNSSGIGAFNTPAEYT